MIRFLLIILSLVILIGCGDEDTNTSILSPIDDPVIDFIAAAPAINISRPYIRVFYVEPKTQLVPSTDIDYQLYTNRIDSQVKEVQMFFASEMERHGYGRKTFTIKTDNNKKLIIERIKTDNDLNYYLNHDNSYSISNEMHDRLGNVYDYDKREIRLFFVDFPGHGACGFAYGGTSNGSAYVFGGCWTKEIIAHELGHAFGLWHDWRNGEYVMSYGQTKLNDEWKIVLNPKSKISSGAAGWLNRHPAFNLKEVDISNHVWIDNFQVVNPNENELHFKFTTEYYPKGHMKHNDSLDSILSYAVFLNTTTGPDVIRFIGSHHFDHEIISRRTLTDTGPVVINQIEYNLKFKANLPEDLTNFQVQFLSKYGHRPFINSMSW